MMEFKSIQLNNFLCFYGETSIAFCKGLNLILGANGYGKTKFFDAIYWVFNDYISTQSGHESTSKQKGNLINDKAKYETNIHDSINCSVSIEIEGAHNKQYKLQRSYSIKKLGDNEWSEPNESVFTIYQWDIIHYKPINPILKDEILSSLIPNEVRPYLWFQGEKGINKAIDTTNNESLKKVIKQLSYIEHWDKYIDVAQKAFITAEKEFASALRNTRKNKDEIRKLQERKDQLTGNQAFHKQLLEKAQQNLQRANEDQIAVIGNLTNAQTLHELDKQKVKIGELIRQKEKEIDLFYLGFNKRIFTKQWLLIGTNPILQKAEPLLNAYFEAVHERRYLHRKQEELDKGAFRLPHGVPEPMHIRKMLEKQHCLVCNRPALKGTEPYNAIEELLPKLELKINRPINFRNENFFRKLTQTDTFEKNINNIGDSIIDAFEEEKQLVSKLEELKKEYIKLDLEYQNQFSSSNITSPQDIIRTVEMTRQDILRYSHEVAKYEQSLKVEEKELIEVNVNLSRISKDEIKSSIIKKRDLLEGLSSLAERTKLRKYQELLNILETKANEHYKNINENSGAFYGKIKFIESSNKGFQPFIVDASSNDEQIISTANASLLSSMKIAIIMAVVSANKIRNYNSFYPLVADAPVSDFDPVKTQSFLKEVSSTFNQSLIMFYEFLNEDSSRNKRFIPDENQLIALKEKLKDNGKEFRVFQLDLEDNITQESRNEVAITLKKIMN